MLIWLSLNIKSGDSKKKINDNAIQVDNFKGQVSGIDVSERPKYTVRR